MIIALINQKGGVGKSTIAGHLAVWLWEQHKSVCLVDADVQRSSSIWLKEAAPELAQSRIETQDDLLERVPILASQFQDIVIDAPGGLSELSRASLFVSDLALLPCGPTAMELRSGIDSIRVLRQAQAIRKGPPRALFVPNKLRRRGRLSKEFLVTAKTLDIPASSGLRLLDAFADAVQQGTVVWKMGAPATEASNDIKNLFMELFGHESEQATNERSIANG